MLFLIPIPDSPALLPEFLGSPPAPLAAPLAGAGRRSLESDTRLKTKQFLGELYRNNICTRVEITLVGCRTFNHSHFYNCQARVQSPNRKLTKSLKEEKKKGFGLRGDTKITWATTTPHHPTYNF